MRQKDTEINTTIYCTACGCCFNESAIQQLWDGKQYCNQCLDKYSPDLREYASKNICLEEEIPLDSSYLMIQCIIAIIVSFIIFLLIALDAGAPLLQASIFLALFCTLGSVMFFSARYYRVKRLLPTIMVERGLVRINRPTFRMFGDFVCTLDDCRWWIGKTKEDTFTGPIVGSRHPAVIISTPIQISRLLPRKGKRQQIACGYSTTKREIWVAFLRIAKVKGRDGV